MWADRSKQRCHRIVSEPRRNIYGAGELRITTSASAHFNSGQTNTDPARSSDSWPVLHADAAWAGNASFEQTTDITLSWTTDCPQSYAELWGGPYGTVSLGGWQAATSIHIGQMYGGTYMWHVKGRSSDGNETGWSDTWSFAIASNPPPNSTPTDTPVPYATATPTPVPQPTATSTPCPYADNHGQFPTFYASPDWQGQSVSFSINPGQDTFFIFPNWLQQNLESFTDPYGAFHLVTYHTTDHGGNLAHWDSDQPGPLPNTDGYQLSASVEIYFHRTC